MQRARKKARLKNTFYGKTGPASSLGFFCITNDFFTQQKAKYDDTKIPALIFNFIRQTRQRTRISSHFPVLSCYTTQTIVHLTNANGCGSDFISFA